MLLCFIKVGMSQGTQKTGIQPAFRKRLDSKTTKPLRHFLSLPHLPFHFYSAFFTLDFDRYRQISSMLSLFGGIWWNMVTPDLHESGSVTETNYQSQSSGDRMWFMQVFLLDPVEELSKVTWYKHGYQGSIPMDCSPFSELREHITPRVM